MADERDAPAVVAIGGGHGLAVTLQAAARYAGALTAVVSVADDGGSSGRLRRDLDVVPPGDLRKCLLATTSPDGVWTRVFAHRFEGGELGGHALGNLVLVGLAETLGDLGAALDEAGALLDARARVRPATTERVVLKAQVGDQDMRREVEGQVAVMETRADIRRVELVPSDVPADPVAIDAISGADQVVLAPGSLFTSLLPALMVPGIRDAVCMAAGQVVQVGNLAPQIPETEGLDGVDHLRAVLEHGARVDVLVSAEDGLLDVADASVEALGVRCVRRRLSVPGTLAHDPAELAEMLAHLL